MARARRNVSAGDHAQPDGGDPPGTETSPDRRSERRRTIAAFAVVAILGLIAAFVVVTLNAPRTVVAAQSAAGVAQAPPAPPGAEVVYFGIEPINVYAISLGNDTFQSTFVVWWRWKGKIDPAPSTELLNSANSSNTYSTLYSYTSPDGRERPIKLKNGDSYQAATISSGFTDPFSLSRYPLDSQTLGMVFENNTYDYNDLVYVPDLASMEKHSEFEVADWKLSGESIGQYLHTYNTDFGAPGVGKSASQYSRITYEIAVERPVAHFLVKLFLPMFVVMIAALCALFVKADHFDVRLAMAGTGLLTLIFLQQGYAGDLPSTSPVVLMDEIYALAYVAVGATFLRVVWTTVGVHRHRRATEFITLDHRLAVSLLALFLIGSTLLVAA